MLPVLLAAPACAQTEAQRQSARKPLYRIDLDLDYELLTFRGEARIRVPAAKGDPLADVILLLHANSIIADERRKNLSVDAVSSKGKALPYTLQGAVLRVQLPETLTDPFDLEIVYRGVVPRQPDSEGMSLDGLLGPGLGELGGLLGASGTPQSKKQPDYGLYAYGNGVLSLGAFWYPQLAVRGEGKWMDFQQGFAGVRQPQQARMLDGAQTRADVAVYLRLRRRSACEPGHEHPWAARGRLRR